MTRRLHDHLVKALADHKAWCRVSGLAPPPEIDLLLALLTDTAGPQGSDLALDDQEAHDDHMLLDEGQVARRLNVSGRTVRRLVSRGAIKSVRIGRTRRFRVADLDAYVEQLRSDT